MTEDSGAFKTNPRNHAQFGHFVMFPDASFRSSSASLASLFAADILRARRNDCGILEPA
jgi:hypothetical protein